MHRSLHIQINLKMDGITVMINKEISAPKGCNTLRKTAATNLDREESCKYLNFSEISSKNDRYFYRINSTFERKLINQTYSIGDYLATIPQTSLASDYESIKKMKKYQTTNIVQ